MNERFIRARDGLNAVFGYGYGSDFAKVNPQLVGLYVQMEVFQEVMQKATAAVQELTKVLKQ